MAVDLGNKKGLTIFFLFFILEYQPFFILKNLKH
jgi:hypothetical protein